ncbi:MAG: hypothetical protein AAB403_06910, partial [Planctomycetota bacterium]
QLGVGFSTYIEMCGLAPSRILGALNYGGGGWESMSIRCLPTARWPAGRSNSTTGSTAIGSTWDPAQGKRTLSGW